MRRLRDGGFLTETLGIKLEEIIAYINDYLRAKNRRRPKKRKVIEEKDNDSVNLNHKEEKEIKDEISDNCVVMNCDSKNCDDINNNSINYTTITTEEEIEEEIFNIVQ